MSYSTGRGSDLDAELSRLNERINDLEYRQAQMMERLIRMIAEGRVNVAVAGKSTDDRQQLLYPNRLPGFD